MPRTTGLRRHKAAELMRLLKNGPSLGYPGGHGDNGYTPEDAMQKTRLWLNSWVTPLVKQLVPELKEKK